MRKALPLLVAIGIFQSAIAQQPSVITSINPYPKTITVSGSAEMEIVPDQIFVNIQLTEYQKRGETKRDLETIKTQFLESCKAVNIPDSAITISSYSGSNGSYYYMRKKKPQDLFSSITYQIKFKSSELMDKLVDKLDDNATQNFQVASTSHSKMSEYRKQLKIMAIQAAKDKGIYLSDAIGEKIGETITITEPAEWQQTSYGVNALRSQAVYRARDEDGYDGVSQALEFKKIKLRYEVNVVFALK